MRKIVKIRQIKQNNRAKKAKFQVESVNNKILSRKTLKYYLSDQIISTSFSKDIILSPSGQVKMDSLNSCLSLIRSDFIVF